MPNDPQDYYKYLEMQVKERGQVPLDPHMIKRYSDDNDEEKKKEVDKKVKSLEEFDKQFEELYEERNNIDKECNKEHDKLDKRYQQLYKQRKNLLKSFEDKVRKLFGVVDVTVEHDKHHLTIGARVGIYRDIKPTILFDYDFENIRYESIEVRNADIIKTLYEEVYGYPQKKNTKTACKIETSTYTLCTNEEGEKVNG